MLVPEETLDVLAEPSETEMNMRLRTKGEE
jgi:hypothetical protein